MFNLQDDFFRAAPTSRDVLNNLEYLAGLAGTWVGDGFSLTALPDQQHHKPFHLKLNATKEILSFTPIGAPIPNRGSTQGDIAFFGLHYFQQVSNDATNEALHLEPGIWLAIPKTTDPKQGETVVRLSTIPHGNSLLAQGPAPYKCAHKTGDKCGHKTIWGRPGPPKIGVVDAFPFIIDPITNYRQDLQDPQYLKPYLTTDLPAGIPLGAIANPNLVLIRALQRQAKQNPDLEIVHTVQLNVSATPIADIADIELDDDDEHCCKPEPKAVVEPPEGASGGITNIPFLVTNADATSFAASFWIETVKNKKTGNEFVQLQYSQTAILDFEDRKWPHITVATLVQQ